MRRLHKVRRILREHGVEIVLCVFILGWTAVKTPFEIKKPPPEDIRVTVSERGVNREIRISHDQTSTVSGAVLKNKEGKLEICIPEKGICIESNR